MNCKYCGAEMPEDKNFCPECGKAQTEEADAAETEAEQTAETTEAEPTETQQQTAGQAAPAQDAPKAETPKEPDGKQEKKKTAWLLSVAIAALVIIIALLVVKIVRDSQQPETLPAEGGETVVDTDDGTTDDADSKLDSTGDGESTEIPLNGVSYTVTEDALTDEVLDRVVATCGGQTLTNRDLPIYYWRQYMSFANSYSTYLSYLMDTSKPLDQQMYDEDNTWQQYFLTSALDMFQYYSAVAQEAEANGFQLSADSEDILAQMPANLESAAQSYGFEDANAYLEASFGPSVTQDSYIEFLRLYLTGAEYLSDLIDAQQPTDAEVSQYYDDNADTYAENHVEKIDKPMVNVRHILIQPEQAEDGTITDEAWAAAEQEANDILDEWLAGDRTEASFADLANEHSSDPGSNTNGGLYEDVYPGQMVETFNDWCFADGRQTGDYGIVKTDYGYHIMFFSSVGENVYWFQTAKKDYMSELSAKIGDEIVAKYSFETNVENAALVDVLFADQDAAAK